MYSRVVILCAAAALLAVSVAPADDKPAPDKPPPEKPAPDKPKGTLKDGADLPGPFRPYNVTGKFEKKFHCITNEHGLNPTVMIFAQNVSTASGSPLSKLLRGLDKYIGDRPKTRLNAFAVFLFNDLDDVVTKDDERAAHADELNKLKNAEQPPLQQVVLCLDSAAGLKRAGYDLDPEKPVIVVLYDKLKVTKIYPFKEMTDADVATIMKEVTENFAPFKK
jgi:hypothetical protein